MTSEGCVAQEFRDKRAHNRQGFRAASVGKIQEVRWKPAAGAEDLDADKAVVV